MTVSPAPPRSKRVTVLALVALVAGFTLGAIARETGTSWLLAVSVVAKPLGTLWTNTLRMIVLPMMISYLMLAISSLPKGRTAGILGATALVSFVTMLGLTGLLSALGTPSLLAMLPIAHADAATFAAGVAPAAKAATQVAVPTVRDATITHLQ